MTLLTAIAIVMTVFAIAVGGLYFSGYADDLLMHYAKKFYEAKAKTEVKAMENLGEGKAKDFVKGQFHILPRKLGLLHWKTLVPQSFSRF